MKSVLKLLIKLVIKFLNLLSVIWVGYFNYSRVDLFIEEIEAGELYAESFWAFVIVFIVIISTFIFLLKSLIKRSEV